MTCLNQQKVSYINMLSGKFEGMLCFCKINEYISRYNIFLRINYYMFVTLMNQKRGIYSPLYFLRYSAFSAVCS